VPAEQGFWLDEEPPPTSTIKESTQPSEQCPMSWSQGRSGYLATEDGTLMVELAGHNTNRSPIIAGPVIDLGGTEPVNTGSTPIKDAD
jgi:hypothetical protein